MIASLLCCCSTKIVLTTLEYRYSDTVNSFINFSNSTYGFMFSPYFIDNIIFNSELNKQRDFISNNLSSCIQSYLIEFDNSVNYFVSSSSVISGDVHKETNYLHILS